MKHIYIVIGSQGSYSDFNEWPVVAYTNERKAKEHVDNAQQRAMEIQAEIAEAIKLTAPAYWKRIEKVDQSNKYDPESPGGHQHDEIDYCLWKVEVEE